jgi:hypothetical protein
MPNAVTYTSLISLKPSFNAPLDTELSETVGEQT